jgi:aldehyde dehydrogenase (NAD+)
MESEFTDYQPLGVVGQIIPWNFPLLMLAWKIAPALAMGNTVVLKPAEFTSLTALKFAELCLEIGLPPGVVNIVTGDGAVGEMIVKHPGINKIAFTGSTEVGKIIRRAIAGSGKKLSLELGGKSPFIVFDDADLDSVVEGVVDAIWFNQGQVCCAGSRLLVQEGIASRLYEKLKSRMQRLKVGDPLDKGVDIGAIIAPEQLEKITQLVNQGKQEGAQMWQPSWACPRDGYFYPPTLFTDVAPASTIAQVEIFGPVLVAMSFRTPAEAVKLANNTRFGLAASVWTENINLALDIAPQIKAGAVWVNSTNLFDAASGFGGYRESGFGREGGREGLAEYIKPAVNLPALKNFKRDLSLQKKSKSSIPIDPLIMPSSDSAVRAAPPIDRTAKLFIGGKQSRPDSGYSRNIFDRRGKLVGTVSEGNRKDLRNAVEAAHAASGWSKQTSHNRAQIIYYIAENLAIRSDEFVKRLQLCTNVTAQQAKRELSVSIEQLFNWAAWADKHDGAVHHTPLRNVTLAMPEAIGVVAIVCDDPQPLAGFVATTIAAIAMGNTVVVVPSQQSPLLATDFYQVLETSDLPAGVVNIVTGGREALAEVLAAHDDVDAIWYFGTQAGSTKVELLAAENMKRSWVNYGAAYDWLSLSMAQLRVANAECLYHATQVKNIWVPYGE